MSMRSMLLLPWFLLATLFTFCTGLCLHAQTFRNPHRIPLTVDPYGLTTGDLNGDGRNDIVWTERSASSNAATLHVLLAAGAGQYNAAPDLSVPFNPSFIDCILEEVTGDKRNDLVCIGASNNYVDVFMLTYPGNGDGTFAPVVQTKLSNQPVSFSNPILAPAGDLNGDGLADVLVMTAYSSLTLPFLSDGKGGFKAGTSFQGSFNFSVPKLADLNGDGTLDVLWPTGPRVNLGKGDGTFGAPVQYDPGYDSNCAFGDVDHDGHLDAVCTWLDYIDINGKIHLTVLHGNADGSFSKTPLFTRTFGTGESEYDGIPTILTPVLVTDLNGDGYADIVSLSGDGYCVLLGGPNVTWNGQPHQFVTASEQSEGGLDGIYGVSIADMDGDGLLDIVAIGPNGLYITYAQHDGTLSSAPAIELGQVSTSATLVDVNGDGNLDAVSTGDTALKLSLGHGDGTFDLPVPITSSANFTKAVNVVGGIVSGDFNGDGKQDLLATGTTAVYVGQNYLLFGHGDGTFSAPLPISIALGKVADLNNDGKSDVIGIQNTPFTNEVLVTSLSRGDGTFLTTSTNLPVEITPGGFTSTVVGTALADFRHSGYLDAAVASFSNAYLMRNHGDGSFDTNPVALPIPDLPNLSKVGTFDTATGDFDGDGNADIAVLVQYGTGIYSLSTPTSAAWVFYGKGDGTFTAAVLAGTFNRDAQTITAGDLDGDGLADLVLTSNNVYQYTGVLVVHALPNRTWGPETDLTGGEGLSPVWITDINHDGHNDLIFGNANRLNEAGNSISILLNEVATAATGTLTASPEPSEVTYPFTLQAALIPGKPADILTGSVTFSFDGTVLGSSPLNNNTASFSPSGSPYSAGTHTLSATWPGDAAHLPLTLNGSHVISLLPLSITLVASPTSVSSGTPVTATATFTSSLQPNQQGYQYVGSMTLYDNGTAIAMQQVSRAGFSFTLPSLATGSHLLSVSYTSDPLFSAAQSNSVTVHVAGAPSTATLTATPSTISFGKPINFTALIAPATGAGTSVPTGTVTFIVDSKSLSPVALTNAVAASVLSNLAASSHTVSCTYSGDNNFAPSTCNTLTVTVSPQASALTITSSQNPSLAYAPVTFTIHLMLGNQPAPAGLPFTFSISGNSGNILLTTDANGNATYTTDRLFA
ncbi:MAG: FG-GAP-like repeat-containing protein, partial [Janthinobacterium lividum]